MTVLRRGYVPVEPDTTGFDDKLKENFRKTDPGGKAGKQIGGQLNRALKRLNLDPIDVKADPKKAFAAIEATEAKLKELARESATVEVKIQTERALSQMARFKKQLGDQGGEAAEEFTSKFSRDVAGLGTVLDRLDLPSIDITGDPSQAFRSIDETEARLRKLSTEGATVEIRVEANRALGDLSGIKKQLGGGIEEAVSEGLGVLKSPAAWAPAAAAAAPVIGGVISAAVIGGAGVGGVIGGVLLLKDNAEVKAAGKALGENLLGDLTDDAAPFVAPILQAVDRVEDRFALMDDRLKGIFKTSSGFLNPLVDGALDGLDGILDGVSALVTEGKPAIDAFGESFGILGHSVGDALETISGGSEESASALVNVATAIGVVIEGTGYLIRGFTEAYNVIAYVPGKIHAVSDELGLLVGVGDDAGESVAGAAAETYKLALASQEASRANSSLVATEADVTAAQKAVTQSQKDYTTSLNEMGPSAGRAAQYADGLRKATQQLYGAQIAAADANEGYEASWDSLSGSIQANGRSLNIHTAAGRSNRDALQALLAKSNEMYYADINAGVAIDSARKKHEARTAAVKEESRRLGLNKTATGDLINTYGQIPKKKQTDLVVAGVNGIVSALKDLYVLQRSLADGIPIDSEIAKLNQKKGPAKRYGGYHTGGFTGDGGKYETAGVVHRKEFVLRSEATEQIRRNHPGFLEEANATGQLPGYAGGGMVAPIDTSRRWPFEIDARNTKVLSRKEASAKVAPAFGNWPSSPAAQRGDSGVWRSVVRLIKSTGPISGSFGNSYRPGDPLWHGSGRAVDWMGYNQDALATFLSQRRPLELIHRTRQRDYAYTRGKDKGSFNNALMEAHRNHVHIAMDDGGVRMLQPGLNIIPNGTGKPEPIAGPNAMAALAGGNTYNITVNVPVGAHPAETGRQVVEVIRAYEQRNGTRWRS